MKRRRIRKPPKVWQIAMLSLPAFLALGIYLLWYFPYLFVKNIEVRGLHILTKNEVVQLLDLGPETALYAVRVGKLKNNLQNNQWVLDATITREFPDTLQIVIEERVPVAQLKVTLPPEKSVETDDKKGRKAAKGPRVRYYILDKKGILLQIRSGPWKTTLYEFVGNEFKEAKLGEKLVGAHLSTFLKAIQVSNRYIGGKVLRFEIKPGDQVTMVTRDGLPIRLGRADKMMEKLAYLNSVLSEVQKTEEQLGVKALEVDFSNPGNNPVIRVDRAVQP